MTNSPLALSPAAMDLGLGGGGPLQQQLNEEEVRRKKKLMQQAQALSPATAALFPGMGNGFQL